MWQLNVSTCFKSQSNGLRHSGAFMLLGVRRKEWSIFKVQRQLDARQWSGNSILVQRKCWHLSPSWTRKISPQSKMEEGKSLPRLCVGMADWLHPAGNRALEKMPKENGNILRSFSFITTLFRKKKVEEVSAEKLQRELGNHLLLPKLEKKKKKRKCKMQTDLVYLFASCLVPTSPNLI